jgi:hypothetical protein
MLDFVADGEQEKEEEGEVIKAIFVSREFPALNSPTSLERKHTAPQCQE